MTDYNHKPVSPRAGLAANLAAATAEVNEFLWTTDTFRLYVEQDGNKKLVGEPDFVKLTGGTISGDLTVTGALSGGTFSVASKFSVDANGNITKLRNVTTSFPSANAAGYLKNNGSGTLSWAGVAGTMTQGDVPILWSVPEKSTNSPAPTYVKLKEITIQVAGTFSIKFEVKTTAGSQYYAYVGKNDGTRAGTLWNGSDTTYVEKQDDLAFAVGDKIQLYALNLTGSSYYTYVKNFKVCCTDSNIGSLDTE